MAWSGTGTASDPWLFETWDDLCTRNYNGDVGDGTKYYKMKDDPNNPLKIIDLNEISPSGARAFNFNQPTLNRGSAIIDFNNYTIKNWFGKDLSYIFRFAGYDMSGYSSSINVTIKNLKFLNAFISSKKVSSIFHTYIKDPGTSYGKSVYVKFINCQFTFIMDVPQTSCVFYFNSNLSFQGYSNIDNNNNYSSNEYDRIYDNQMNFQNCSFNIKSFSYLNSIMNEKVTCFRPANRISFEYCNFKCNDLKVRYGLVDYYDPDNNYRIQATGSQPPYGTYFVGGKQRYTEYDTNVRFVYNDFIKTCMTNNTLLYSCIIDNCKFIGKIKFNSDLPQAYKGHYKQNNNKTIWLNTEQTCTTPFRYCQFGNTVFDIDVYYGDNFDNRSWSSRDSSTTDWTSPVNGTTFFSGCNITKYLLINADKLHIPSNDLESFYLIDTTSKVNRKKNSTKYRKTVGNDVVDLTFVNDSGITNDMILLTGEDLNSREYLEYIEFPIMTSDDSDPQITSQLLVDNE